MRNTLRKSLVIMLALVMALAFCACGEKQEETGIANPFVETDQEGVVKATGIEIAAPEGAENVSYSYCDAEDDSFAQVIFTLDGKEYTYRIMMVPDTSMFGEQSEDQVPDINKMLEEQTNAGVKLAGIHGEWDSAVTTMVSYCEGLAGVTTEGAGFIAWLDPVPGAMYSLSLNEKADIELLRATAEKCFVPMQGDV